MCVFMYMYLELVLDVNVNLGLTLHQNGENAASEGQSELISMTVSRIRP